MITRKPVVAILAVVVVLFATIFAAGCTGSASNTLVVATNAEFQPYEFFDYGKIVGIDIEIMETVAKELGKTVKIENMEFDNVITAIASGKADIAAAGLTVTEDRKENVDFTQAYVSTKQVIIVNKTATRKIINGADDLAGAIIGVQLGTTGDTLISDYKGNNIDIKIERYNKITEAFQSLNQNKIDAVVIDEQPAIKYSAISDNLVILKEEFALKNYAFAIKKGNTDLLNKVNAALDKLKADGTIDAIIEKYIN
ncbi:MAG TPA: transporter substrate-binding domain-containing protein [Methanocorpusculum sp.]|nr:transporter substrate-binding domain-containing protein [Methanocorpusculum sp.]